MSKTLTGKQIALLVWLSERPGKWATFKSIKDAGFGQRTVTALYLRGLVRAHMWAAELIVTPAGKQRLDEMLLAGWSVSP